MPLTWTLPRLDDLPSVQPTASTVASAIFATSCCSVHIDLQGGVIEVGAPTGKWQLIVVYRGKHCPVSRNYLASLQQIIYELDDLGVEVLALTADGREKAEAFVSFTSNLYLSTLFCHAVLILPKVVSLFA